MCVITVKRFVKRINRKIDVRWMAIFDGYKERSIIKLFKYSMLGVKNIMIVCPNEYIWIFKYRLF